METGSFFGKIVFFDGNLPFYKPSFDRHFINYSRFVSADPLFYDEASGKEAAVPEFRTWGFHVRDICLFLRSVPASDRPALFHDNPVSRIFRSGNPWKKMDIRKKNTGSKRICFSFRTASVCRLLDLSGIDSSDGMGSFRRNVFSRSLFQE